MPARRAARTYRDARPHRGDNVCDAAAMVETPSTISMIRTRRGRAARMIAAAGLAVLAAACGDDGGGGPDADPGPDSDA